MPLENQPVESARQDQIENGVIAAQGNAEEAVATSDASCQPVDEQHQVLERLLAAHEVWFDVTRDFEYAGQRFEGYAEFHSHGEKYVLTKRAKLWEVEAHEYLFFKLVDVLDEATFADYLEFMKTQAVQKVEPGPNHMSSYVSLVIVANEISEAAGKALKSVRYHKSFKLGFQGWAEFRFCAVDLSARRVLTNAMGKNMKAALEENAGFEATGMRKFKKRR